MNEPQTPDELKIAFLSVLDSKQRHDELIISAIDELIKKIEAVYCGLTELSSIEVLFGRSLFEAVELNKDKS